METVLDRMKRIDSQGAVPGTSVAEPKQPDDREQAILDRHTSATPQVSALQRAARIDAQREIDVRRQQRAYAEKAKSTDATTVDLTKEILTNLNNRSMVRGTYRQMSPAQRQEVLKLAPGIAQQLGDDRGGLAVRAINAVTGGIADVSQPIKELAGQVTGTDWGGAPEEIEFIRQLEGVSQEFAPARPDDPWYVRGPLQALQMTPWMTTVVGGNVAGSAIAKTGGQVLARGASAGVPLAKPAFQAIGAVGKAPKLLGLKGATTKGTMEGAGGLAGITAAAFPGQYAQEVDSLKELGMEDNLTMRVLAGGTAAIAGLIEGIVPNPFKAGNVPLKEGAIKAARQYLWNAAKQAPGEMSEEYLQGVTSGLGQHVAQYLDENAQEKSIADAFKTGWEQAKEAALPMAFLLGVPAVGGAANAARLARLQAIRAKGPVSRKDARELGIEAEKQEDRTAQADAEIKQLEQEVAQSTATQTVPPVSAGHAFPVTPTVPPYVAPPDGTQAKRVPWYDFGSGEPEGDIPPPPGLGLLDRLTGRSPQGTPPRLPGAPGATGATPPALPEPSGQPTRLPGSSSAAQNPELPAPTGTQPASQQPVEAESQADSPQQEVDSFAEYADAWSEQSAKRRGVEKKPLTQSMLDTLRTTIDNHADAAIQNGRSSKFATDNTAFDEREMREIQNAVRRKGYEVGEVQRSSEGGVDYIGFDVTGKRTGQPPSQASENTAPAPQQPKGGGSTTTAGQVPPITSQSPSTSGLSEGTGTKPKPGSPTVSPDAQAKPETRNGKAEGEKRSSETGPTGQPRRGEVGGKLAAGEVVTTSSGRQTTPFPKIDMGTDRKTGSTLKRVDKWLYDNAVEEARARGDDFNLRQFEAEDPAKMPPASKDAMEEYLFGEQPPVQKPITKPLVPTSATQAEQPEVQGQKPQGLTEGFRSLPAKGQAAFETEWSKGGTSIKNTLYPENKNYRAEFEARTGIKLPKGVGSTFQAVEDWHNAGRPLNPTTETAKPDRPTDWSISGQSKPIPGMESEEATYTVHSRKPDVIPDMFSVVVAGKPTGKGWTTVKGTGMSAEEAYDRAVRMFTDKRAKPQEKFSQDKQSSTPQPPEGYKPLAEFTPMVSVTKSPDLELADNIAEMKDLKLQKGDAVGYRVYPKRGSTKGGYWQYGTVEDTASSSHATIKLADGTTESVGGSRLHKLEPIGEAGLSTTVNKNSDKAPVPKQSEGDSTATAEQSEFDDAALKALDAILGVESPALETKPKATGRKAPTKAASGQFVLPGMPGMAAEIDRQDFVRKHRDQALERLWGWSDKPEDAQDIQGAIDAIAKDVGDVMNAIYSDKGIKNKDDVFASKEYQAFDAAVAAIDNDPIPGEVILNHIDNVVDKALDTRPKPRTLKKPRKSDKTLAEAKSDMQAAHDAAAKLMEKIRSKLMSGVDPELMAETVQVAYLYTKAGIKTFKGYVEAVVESFGESFAREFAPYMESGWRALHTRSVVSDPAGKVDDFLTEVSDETTQSEPGTEGNAPVGDGAGKSQGDAATTGAGTNEGRDVTEDAGQPGDSILPDGAEATQDDGRDSGAGGSTNGDTNADQSGQGQADTADDGAGSDAGSMEERLAVNHVIGADDDLAVSSITKSLDRNIKALNILKVLEKDGRFPDSAERKALAQYTGWGGLSQALDSIKGERMLSEHWMRDEAWEKKWGKAYRKLKELLSKEEFQAAQDSTENAHYTSKPIIQAIWKIAERLGYNGGRVLELGAGIGHFAGLVPSRVRGATQFTMVERDSVSSRIAKMLYPGHEIVAGDMEEFKAVPGSVTLGIGNVPFAGGTVGDSARRYNEPLNLHNYAIARHLDAVAPGGIVVAVSSHSTLDANIKQRKFLATKGELIGAIRLPNDAFAENAKTEVVTDILIFRRPRQGDGTLGVRFDQNADVKVKNKDGEEVSRAINKYFIDNPEMVLGKHSAKGSMYGPDEYTVESTPGDLQAKIDAAIEKLPRNLLGNIDVAEQVVASDATVPFGRLEIQDGKVVMGFGDKFVSIAGKKFAEFPVHLTGKTGVSRAKDYIELRDLLAGVRSTMLDETASDEAVKRSQEQLAASYDRYVKKHGPLNTSKTGIFKRDPDYYRVLALENERAEYNPETKKIEVTYEKAAIFTTRVLGPQREPNRADSPADAMSVSIAWRGAIDSAYIGQLLGVSPQEAEAKLIDEGLAFRNPATTELELADLYLSGNVRSKLSQAEISAEEDPQYKRNVEALTKVLPPPVTIKKDTVRLGATWIPEQVINAFATQEFGTDVKVSYNANTDAWSVGRVHGISETAKSKYETGRIDPDQLLSEVLNLRSIKIYDQVETGEYTASGKPKTTQTLNEKETQAAKHRASVLRAEFEKWVLGNPEVTQVLAKLYNDRYNNFVRTKYNGEFLVLPGANPEITLRPYQKDAIWRIINRGTSLLAHAVGAGKTYTMIGAAMEMRRLGLARRPLLVVQNATLGQFATSFQQMYPNANVLVADKNDLGKGKRQLFLNKISTGNWDAVVMAQSTFDNMASEAEVERAFIQDQLDMLEEAIREEGGEGARTPTVKQLVRTKKSLKARFDKLMGSRAKKEDNVTFEDLGADALFLDEAHAYKKPTFTTKLSQLVGLNVEASARSLATTIKVRSVQAAHNGRNVILATGTPVTNTLGEAWHMVNYVSPATNAEFSSRTFDQFISNFAQVEPTLTMNAGGQYVYKDAIVKFRNGHQLVEYINDSWDIVTPDALRAYMASSKKGFPALRGGQPSAITVDRTPGVAVFMDFISQVYAKYKGLTAKERRELSFIPALAYGASKAATLDIRLVVPNAAEEKNSKLQKAAEEIKRIYDESTEVKGTQLFFSDMKNPFSMSRLRQFMGGETIDAFDEDVSTDEASTEDTAAAPVDDNESGSFLYQELRRKLLGMGIPKEQIAFISDAKTDKQRQALFERVNNGDIRVLIGSTAKMGIGVNVQKKLVALHHFDTPWLPADLEQREGRILRFGNENDTVDILRYAMKKTLDGAIYMATARKQKFIWQVLNGQLDGDSFEDPSSAAMLSIEEQLAAIQDDPVFFEKIEIQNRVREMELERQSFYDAQQRIASSLSSEKFWLNKEETSTLPQWQRRLEKVKQLQAIKGAGGLETFSMTYGNQTFDDPKKAAEFIKSKVDAISKYVIENHERSQSFDKAGGLLSLGKNQKVEFEIGPAKVVIGAEPKGAFVETDKGYTVTEFTARFKSLAYLQEPGGRHEFYEGTATTPATFFDKMQSLPEVAQKEVNESEARVSRYHEKIKELEGLLGKQWEDQAEYDAKKGRLGEIEQKMLASKGNLATEEKTGEDPGADTDSDMGGGTPHKKAADASGGGESRSLDSFTSPELQDRQSMGAAKRRIASAADLVGDDDGGSSSRYASPDKEFERRWQMATRGISKKTLATKLREFWQELVKSTVRGSLPELPRTEQFGEARSAMHAYQNAPVYAQLAAADLLKKTSKPLSASDYDLFTRVVIMRDQVEAASKGERLSYGLTPEKAQAELARVESLAANNERVQASLEYRRQWTEAMVDDFLSAHEYLGLDMSDRFKRENYFRHQVLYYMEAQQRGLGKKKVELTPNRGWLKGRTSGDDLGEAFDINANYLQAEWEVSTQMIADTKRAQAIGRLKRHYDKMRQLKEKAKYNNYVAVVGGLENMQEIEELRGLMAELRESGSLDSGEKAQLKEWSERLWELDPTMPFRQWMAIARDQIERGAAGLGEDASGDFMRYVSSLAKRDDSPLQGPALSFLKALSDRKAFIKNALGDQYQTWEDVVPDDHEEVAIRPGRAMFQAYSVPEQVASELMADLSKTLGISAEDLRPLTALGSKYTPLVVPQEVAAQMAAIDNKMDFGWLDRAWTRPMNAWKRWVLMSPTRVFKYNLRNLSEVDKVMGLNPAALKDIPQAIRDLWKLYSGADDIPATVRDWVERGGSGTLVRVNELGELNELKQFAKLIADKRSGVVGKVIKAPASAWKAYWSAAGISSDFRESILRYAAYLNYLKQLDAGKLTNYGGSVRAEVDGIKDNKDKAMRLSADLLGDYGDISLVGQFLRSRFAPFWSFQETNLRTYFRGLVNLASNEQSAIKAGMQIARSAGIGGLAKTPFLAYKLGRIAILFYGLKAMTTAFNQLLFGDDDDELSEEEKRKAHLTFGKNSKGEVQYFSRIGTAADVLDWVGLDSVDYDLRDVLDGRRTLKEVLNDMARSPVDKAYGMLSPFIKVPTELAVGQTAYPSVGKPRPIRDRGRYIAQNMGLSKEYDKLTGKPSTPYSVTDLFLYKVEPGTSDYYLTLDAKFRWLKTARNRGVGYSDSSRGNALRNYKMAVRLKDQTAADKYLAEYEADEGTKEGLLDSLEWSHPAGGLSTIDAYLFYKSLAPVEQAEYRDAERFYYSELLTEEQAKTIRARRDKRLRDLAVGKNKDGSPKGKPVRQRGEAFTQYRERLSKWQDEREIAREALQEFK